jgi:hypothetical protein
LHAYPGQLSACGTRNPVLRRASPANNGVPGAIHASEVIVKLQYLLITVAADVKRKPACLPVFAKKSGQMMNAR